MSGEQFKPFFGPNGAASSTRASDAEEADPPSAASALVTRAKVYWSHYMWFAAFGAVTLLCTDLRRDSEWWAGLFFGAYAVLAAHCVLRLAQQSARRWRLGESGSNRVTPSGWLRVLVAATEILGSAGFCAWFVANTSSLNGELSLLQGGGAALAISMGTIRVVVEQLNAWDLEPAIFPNAPRAATPASGRGRRAACR